MLVTLQEILKLADKKENAIGSFNTPNLESLHAVIGAAERKKQPVILMHAQIHEEMGLCDMEEISQIMLWGAKRADIPVCVHLDHGTDIAYLKKGLELGFTSVMYDGSELSVEENLANTKKVVEMAKNFGASVEAEVGSMGAREGGGSDTAEACYTDPDTAAMFVKDTGIDALACAFGTVHGVYLKTPKLDFARLETIRSRVNVPLVMHGGSGVSKADYQKSIQCGIRKINYYTYMAKAGADAVAGKTYSFYHDLIADATAAMEQDVQRAIEIFQMDK